MKNRIITVYILFFICLLCGCSSLKGEESAFHIEDNNNSPLSASPASKQDTSMSSKGTRDNSPICLIPVAEGTICYGNSLVTIDASESENGYFMICYQGQSSKVKLQITGPDMITYTYNLSTSYEAFPLTSGNGNYTVSVYENISDNRYASVFEKIIAVDITNEFGPYLYPNQYINFSSKSTAVGIAKDLSYSANSDIDVITNIYNHIISTISYDYEKAQTVQSGYLPDIDQIIAVKKGICFDYAAVMTAMLRSQRIPTRLEIGYAGDAYHAWISVFTQDKGWINGIIEFDGNSWKLMDPTFAASESEKELKKFMGDGSNYTTKYIY